jgi:hypothetical protein
MTGFISGMIVMAVIWGVNAATRNIMSKIHKNNVEEMARLKIPVYPIISYIRFHLRKDDKDNI